MNVYFAAMVNVGRGRPLYATARLYYSFEGDLVDGTGNKTLPMYYYYFLNGVATMRQRTSVLRKAVVIAQCKKVWEGWEGDLPLMILGLIDCDAWRVAIDVSLLLLLLFLNIPSAKNDMRTRGVFEGCCVTCGKCVAVVIGMEGGSAVTPAYSFVGKVRVLGSLYPRARLLRLSKALVDAMHTHLVFTRVTCYVDSFLAGAREG